MDGEIEYNFYDKTITFNWRTFSQVYRTKQNKKKMLKTKNSFASSSVLRPVPFSQHTYNTSLRGWKNLKKKRKITQTPER